MDTAPQAVFHGLKGTRTSAPLNVGNIEFNRTEEDLSERLGLVGNYFCTEFIAEKIAFLRVNDRSKYGFIELSESWSQAAMVDVSDLLTCSTSGRIEYCRQIRFLWS